MFVENREFASFDVITSKPCILRSLSYPSLKTVYSTRSGISNPSSSPTRIPCFEFPKKIADIEVDPALNVEFPAKISHVLRPLTKRSIVPSSAFFVKGF